MSKPLPEGPADKLCSEKQVPSMQRRQATQNRPNPPRIQPDSRLAGRIRDQHLPPRTTKQSEKLVLLPEPTSNGAEIEEKTDYDEDNEEAPTKDDEETLRKTGGRKGKSYAERLPKARRAEKLARVTAYCTAQAYKLRSTAVFLKDRHAARTKLYDDCLYVVYRLPFLPGHEGYRIQSSPTQNTIGGKPIWDEAIERSELRDYGGGYFEEGGGERFDVGGGNDTQNEVSPQQEEVEDQRESDGAENNQLGATSPTRSSEPKRVSSEAFNFAEMYVFSYGVAVFWNFTERQERDILADLTFAEADTGTPLLVRPQTEDDFETEEFHFEYSPHIPRPRIFHDMITLRSGDHMIKLAMSHAIAQSTKVCFFEQRMANQMYEAQHVPKRLALEGTLGLNRREVLRILGSLFKSRVDINLSSNVLDVPNFFWESEPTLHPLYFAVREYLEIKPRIQVLNERCQVFLDLAEILSDSIADKRMSSLTWIIIVLIILSIVVTCSEVFLRFGILTSRGGNIKTVLSPVTPSHVDSL